MVIYRRTNFVYHHWDVQYFIGHILILLNPCQQASKHGKILNNLKHLQSCSGYVKKKTDKVCFSNWVSEATLQVTLSLRPLRKCVLLGEKQSKKLKLFVKILLPFNRVSLSVTGYENENTQKSIT